MNSDIFILIERIANMLRYESRNQGAQLGLLPVQQEALYYLSICNRYSDTLLAVTDYLGLTKGTVSQTLKVLETKGLVEKKRDSVDKRVTHLTATQAGLDYLAQTYPSAQFREMVKGLSEQEHQLISSSLKTLLRHYQVSTGRKGFGVCQSCRYNQTTDTGFVCGLTQEPLGEQEIGLICREFVEKDKATQSYNATIYSSDEPEKVGTTKVITRCHPVEVSTEFERENRGN